MAIAEIEREYAPELVEKVVLVADYDARITPGEGILEHGVSRVSVGAFLGLVVARGQREAFRGAVVVFEHETMRDAHRVPAGRSYFPVEENVPAGKLADFVRYLIPGAPVVVCNQEQTVGEVLARFPQVAGAEDLVSLGLVAQV